MNPVYTLSHPIYLISILILSFCWCPDFSNCLFRNFILFTCMLHDPTSLLILLHLITLMIFGKEYKLCNSYYANFFQPFVTPPHRSKYSPYLPVLRHPQLFLHPLEKWDLLVDSNGFWQWCTTLGITKFLDFVHRPVFCPVCLWVQRLDKCIWWTQSKKGKEQFNLYHLETLHF
jgi:hypothetical protein